MKNPRRDGGLSEDNLTTKDLTMATITHGPAQINTEYGDSIEVSQTVAYIRPEKTPHPYRKFITMNAIATREILDCERLTDKEVRVFMRLVADMGVNNAMEINQSKFAEHVKISRVTINKMLKKFVEMDLISKRRDGQHIYWTINPAYAWHGQRQELTKVMKDKRAETLAKARRNNIRLVEDDVPY